MQNHAGMSGAPPLPPPFVNVAWNASSGFQNEHHNVPPPPGVSSAPSTLKKPSFPWSPAPGLGNQEPATSSLGIAAGVYPQHTSVQPTFTNANESPRVWPIPPSIQSPGVIPDMYLQRSLRSQTPPKSYGAPSFSYGSHSTGYGAQNIMYGSTNPGAHNTMVPHYSLNVPCVQNPFPIQQPTVESGMMHRNDVSQSNKFDEIDVKKLIPNLKGLIAEVNESVKKILGVMKIRPDTLPLKSLDPRAVGSTRLHLATHGLIVDSMNHRACSESVQIPDEFATASTIFNNLFISLRESRDNVFYKDAPGVVKVPVYTDDESFERFKLPDFAKGERWDELTPQGFGTDRQVQGTLLPSRYWLVCKEISEWKDLPKKLTPYQVKATAGLALIQQADLKKWLLTHGRSYGVTCSSSLADHIVSLLVFCLRAVYREVTALMDSREEVGSADCKAMPQSASWLLNQLSPLWDAPRTTNLVLAVYKYALKVAAYCSVRPLCRGSVKGLEEVFSKDDLVRRVDTGSEQEPCDHPYTSSEDLPGGSSCVGDGVLCLQHLAATILAIQAQAAHEKCKASDLLPYSPYQRSTVHNMITSKAVEIRATRTDFKAVLEHDGLMWQRPQNRDSKTNKTKEELLAEERDYKRRRMSYRGKKVQRTPAEVLRHIIEGHMEDIVATGGIGCIGRRPQDVQLSQPETWSSSTLGAKDHRDAWQKSRSSSRDPPSKDLLTPHRDYNRYPRSESRDSFRTEREERQRSNSVSRHDRTHLERSEGSSRDRFGEKFTERKYESPRDHGRWESKHHGERHHSSKHASQARD